MRRIEHVGQYQRASFDLVVVQSRHGRCCDDAFGCPVLSHLAAALKECTVRTSRLHGLHHAWQCDPTKVHVCEGWLGEYVFGEKMARLSEDSVSKKSGAAGHPMLVAVSAWVRGAG